MTRSRIQFSDRSHGYSSLPFPLLPDLSISRLVPLIIYHFLTTLQRTRRLLILLRRRRFVLASCFFRSRHRLPFDHFDTVVRIDQVQRFQGLYRLGQTGRFGLFGCYRFFRVRSRSGWGGRLNDGGERLGSVGHFGRSEELWDADHSGRVLS